VVRRGGRSRLPRAALARALKAAGREPRPFLLLELAEAGPLTPAAICERRPDLFLHPVDAEDHLEAMWRAGLVRPRGTADDAIGQAPYVLSRTGEHLAILARQLLVTDR
jgi:hypothetical protein